MIINKMKIKLMVFGYASGYIEEEVQPNQTV